ncbi:MAG: DMT family transporter [Xanthobacteraceae bacterium]|nr:DMT family transporter [Xanthobacteraceae bacterium]
MNQNFEKLAARAAPAVFVVLWSSGFIGTKYSVDEADPLTFLTIRMIYVVVVMLLIAAIVRPKWPDRAGIGHSIVAGLLVHGFYLTGVTVGLHLHVPVGVSALIPGLQPILTSTLANRWLGERVTPLQWGGLALGLLGVLLVLHERPIEGDIGWGYFAVSVALVGITLGTLYQKRYCGAIDWRTGNMIQFIACGIVFATGAFLFEDRVVHWTPQFIFGVSYLVFALSIGSIGVLYWLIRHSAATQVASLFYLVPAVTAVMAFVLFDERLDLIGIFGMAIAAAGVFLVNKPQAEPDISPGS